jgi:hypothetical protein
VLELVEGGASRSPRRGTARGAGCDDPWGSDRRRAGGGARGGRRPSRPEAWERDRTGRNGEVPRFRPRCSTRRDPEPGDQEPTDAGTSWASWDTCLRAAPGAGGHRTGDLYSLGVLLYEIRAVGVRSWRPRGALIDEIRNRAPVPPLSPRAARSASRC